MKFIINAVLAAGSLIVVGVGAYYYVLDRAVELVNKIRGKL